MYRLKSLWQQVCAFSRRLTIAEVVLGVFVSIFFAYFFYRSLWALPLMLPIGVAAIIRRRESERKKHNRYHLEQFKECILSVEASLRAGYAVENAFGESVKDMQMMFGEHSRIVSELMVIQKGLRNNETLENLLCTMAEKSENEEILEFAEVFAIAKRNSGNVSDMIALYSTTISRKMESLQEIQTLLAAKRLEQKVMNVMPFGIVMYLDAGNPGYFDMFFHNFIGVLLMTGCLIAYLVAFVWAERIFEKAYE